MATRGKPLFSHVGTDALKLVDDARACGRAWKVASDEKSGSQGEKDAAWELGEAVAKLVHVRQSVGLSDSGDTKWSLFRAENPELAAALGELSVAARVPRRIAHARYARGENPESWDWLEDLERAFDAFRDAVEGAPAPHEWFVTSKAELLRHLHQDNPLSAGYTRRLDQLVVAGDLELRPAATRIGHLHLEARLKDPRWHADVWRRIVAERQDLKRPR